MVWEVGKTFLIILGVVFRTLIFNPTAAESSLILGTGKGPQFC